MKCDRCDKEATVHEVTVRAGQRVERHLCEHCAREQGIAVQTHTPITQLLSQVIAAQAAGLAPEQTTAGAPTACPSCGITHAQFRQTGLLGCPDCYRAFENQLGPLLERAHEGGTHHVGKVPKRLASRGAPGSALPVVLLGGEEEKRQRMTTLQRQLAEAVAAEQYERAAQLRDELGRLGVAARPPATPGAGGIRP